MMKEIRCPICNAVLTDKGGGSYYCTCCTQCRMDSDPTDEALRAHLNDTPTPKKELVRGGPPMTATMETAVKIGLYMDDGLTSNYTTTGLDSNQTAALYRYVHDFLKGHELELREDEEFYDIRKMIWVIPEIENGAVTGGALEDEIIDYFDTGDIFCGPKDAFNPAEHNKKEKEVN